ncbi:peptidoglycan bridge formation glycyltransferase FemA/FemB family protein, partial [Staphylococcus aureus]|nr:peptidoglycan bridge formation glycyltransferase FemA/FemB family protein [Staphylococcus aureus]
LAYIDLNEYLKTLQLKQQQLTAELSGVEEALEESPNSKKNKTKRTQLEQQLNSNKRKIDNTIEQIEQDGAVLNLASALFIYNEHEVYYL